MKFFSIVCLLASSISAAQPKGQDSTKDKPSNYVIQSGMPLSSENLDKPGYSQGARFESGKSWDCTFVLDFNYLQASQDQMELAYTRSTDSPFYPTVNSLGPIIMQDFAYKPGFQFGINVNIPSDKVIVGVNYLWYRGETQTTLNAEGTTYYQLPYTPEVYNYEFVSIDSKWKLGMDLLDLAASRPFYSGRRLVLTPSGGLRAAWIRQKLDIGSQEIDAGDFIRFSGKSDSWAIGPRIGINGNWLFDQGFSLFGDLFTSILYTRYTKLNTYTVNNLNQPDFATLNSYGDLRPVFDMGLGLAWGSYFKKNAYYLSFNASYNFSVFFEQNMIYSVTTASWSGATNSLAGNLYLHGLTLGSSFLF